MSGERGARRAGAPRPVQLAAPAQPRRRRGVPAELLSHGQQRQLEIAVALGGRPRLLLLDEPSSGMSAHERAGLGELLKRVVNTATVVMAEHDVHVVRSVASRVTAFAEGKKIAEGSADEVFESGDVKRVFLRGRRDA
ncbi:MAG: ATP-binding cassette domain-containing protein [Chloroflexi bacterium]|nr:MAG: ATP-binding cassette domain-containing protein [Chloroflexota bacterium]